MSPRMIDLCSGLGGASEAFVDAGWDVMRCDNNELLYMSGEYRVPYTWNFDLSNDSEVDELIHMPYWDNAELIWASPPCVEFSDAYSSPKSIANRIGEEHNPDMTLIRNCIRIIEEKKPKYWVLENVRGSKPFITKELKMPPRQIVQMYYFWGRFPYIHIDSDWRHSKYDNDPWSSHPLRSNYRAKIPLEISNAFLDALTCQSTLEEWY